MAEHLKSASIVEAELRAKFKFLEDGLQAKIVRLETELEDAWSTPVVIVCMVIIFLAGFLAGTVL